jgi:hypothetical protein
MPTTEHETRPAPAPSHDGDHERFTHIVLEGFGGAGRKDRFVPAGTSVAEGIVTGTPVTALCGKVWVPGRDPRRYPVCPTCREVAARMGWSVPAG